VKELLFVYQVANGIVNIIRISVRLKENARDVPEFYDIYIAMILNQLWQIADSADILKQLQ